MGGLVEQVEKGWKLKLRWKSKSKIKGFVYGSSNGESLQATVHLASTNKIEN